MFLNNSSTSGGAGMYAYSSSYTLRNVVFRGNSAGTSGGGIFNYSTSAITPSIINVTMSGNSGATSGGGIYTSSGVTTLIKNSIIWGNTGGEINSPSVVTYSIVQGGGYTGIGNLSVDPKFMSATDLRLQPTSPAIDAGNNSLVSSGITTDLIGNPRFYDVTTVADTGVGTAPIVDIGAYEMQTPPIPASVDNKLALFFVSLGILVMVGFSARTKLTG